MPAPIIREYVEHRGVKYFRARFGPSGKEYWRSARVTAHGGKQMLLHRVLYAEAHGPIPEGCDIHHRDGDGLNNDLGNLEALSRSAHHLADGPRGFAVLDAAARSASRRAGWAKREPRPIVCVECGAEFFSTGMRAMFCGRPCRRRYYARERGY